MTYIGPLVRSFTAKLHHFRLHLFLGVALGVAAAIVACGDATTGATDTFPVPGPDSGAYALADSGLSTSTIDGSVESLYFVPPSATLTVDGVTTQTASYSLHAKLADGTDKVVVPESLEFDRPDLAQVTSTTTPIVLSTNGPYAGTGTLHAIVQGKEADATLTVIVHLRELGPGVDATADATAIAALSGSSLTTDPSLATLQYPYDATVFPLGLASPLLMWAAPQSGDLYRVHYEESGYSYDGFFKVTPPAQVRAAQTNWDHLTASNTGDPLRMSLNRWDSVTSTAYASASQSWGIAGASLRGAIYYWTTSDTGHMSRIRPGTGASPEILNGGACMGCHAVSADGTTLVAAVEDQKAIQEDGGAGYNSIEGTLPDGGGQKRAWVPFDLPDAEAPSPSTQYDRFGGNVAVNPDGKFVVFGSLKLRLADTATDTEIVGNGLDNFTLGAGMAGLMTPAFSPDGKHFAAVQGVHVTGRGNWYDTLGGGNLELFTFDETSKTFSSPTALAASSFFSASENVINYPSFSPDSKWVAFNVGQKPDGCQGDCLADEAQGASGIWLQNTTSGDPVRMTALSDSSLNSADHDLAYEPTFNPVQRGNYFWVVFSSERDWGNRITGTPNNGKKRLWVAAIDATTDATDPSHPAFFLEGQEEDTTNMRGFWALAQCTASASGGAAGGTCGAGFECCSGFCDMGTCVDVSKVTCQGVSETCTTVADCCNPAAVTCTGGKCTPTVPR
jgi:hypothetical protein